MIYLASPYTHEEAKIREYRFWAAKQYLKLQMGMGVVMFSPIVYGHQLSLEGFPITYQFWAPFNDHMILTANRLRVLRLPGWDQSAGIAHELAFADRHGIEIEYDGFEL